MITDKYGNKKWYNKKGELHRDDDLPAIEWSDGTKKWYKNNMIHRVDGPAIIIPPGLNELQSPTLRFHSINRPAVERSDETKLWYLNNELHREDGPAVEKSNGTKIWYQNDALHRVDGPALEHSNGYKEWYLNGELHRVDGPAVEHFNGYKEWYLNGERHRVNGPAVEKSGGIRHGYFSIYFSIRKWFIEDKEYTEEEFKKVIKRRNELARWVYQRWYSDFMRNPNTERGQRYISKDYDRMMKELEVL